MGPNGNTLAYENASNANRDYNGIELTFGARQIGGGEADVGLPAHRETRTMTVQGAAGATRNYFYEGLGSDRAPAEYALDTSLEATYRLFGVDIRGKFRDLKRH